MSGSASFAPVLRKRYNGLDRDGWGDLAGVSHGDTFFDNVNACYSGFGTIGIDVSVTPFTKWDFRVSNFMLTASDAYSPVNTPIPESAIPYFGQKYNVGFETDLSIKFIHSKFLEFRINYARFIPPNFTDAWPQTDPITRILLEATGKF
jgi:hypothetical protein